MLWPDACARSDHRDAASGHTELPAVVGGHNKKWLSLRSLYRSTVVHGRISTRVGERDTGRPGGTRCHIKSAATCRTPSGPRACATALSRLCCAPILQCVAARRAYALRLRTSHKPHLPIIASERMRARVHRTLRHQDPHHHTSHHRPVLRHCHAMICRAVQSCSSAPERFDRGSSAGTTRLWHPPFTRRLPRRAWPASRCARGRTCELCASRGTRGSL
jgi:hypothetical protein